MHLIYEFYHPLESVLQLYPASFLCYAKIICGRYINARGWKELLLIVFNVIKKHSERYETAPVAFIVKQNELYSFTTAKTAYVTEFIEGLITRKPDLSRLSLIFKTLYQIVGAFFPVIKNV